MKYVNPYNFISLSQEGIKKDIKDYTEKEDLYTGKLICRLVAKKPILLPDHEKKDQKWGKDKEGKKVEYEEYPFMTIGGQPMIPGSSLRGVIRSTFEAITDSCMFINDNYYFFSRTGEAKQAGLLEKTGTGWRLHRAIRYADKNNKITSDIKTGDKVKFCGYEESNKKYVSSLNSSKDVRMGYVLKMNRFRNSKSKKFSSYSIFEKIEKEAPLIELAESHILIQTFYENIKKYVENEQERNKKKNEPKKSDKPAVFYKDKLEHLKDGEMIPVWYQNSGDQYYLALSQLSRNVYVKKPKDILPESFKRCNSRRHVCPACALFGFTGEEKASMNGVCLLENESGVGSHIRFSDAWSGMEDILSKESVLLPILSSPRSSSLEFYLRHDTDFYHADSEGVALSGRKFYWHHPDFDVNKLQPDHDPNLTAYMHYVKEGAVFDFEVYFDEITREQLNQLYTALSYGDNNPDGTLCHKIGHGKPLGFGSVKITVEKVIMRTFSVNGNETTYDVDFNGLSKVVSVLVPEEVKIAADFKYKYIQGKTIDYPRNNGCIYGWFSKNRPPKGKAKYLSKLPQLLDENGKANEVTLDENPQRKDGYSSVSKKVISSGKEKMK